MKTYLLWSYKNSYKMFPFNFSLLFFSFFYSSHSFIHSNANECFDKLHVHDYSSEMPHFMC